MIETISTLLAGLFAGAAVYIALVEHPARIDCGARQAQAEFGASYRRGSVFMGALLLGGVVSATGAWFISSRIWWLLGGCLLLALIPLTLVAILPINKSLLADRPDRDSDQVLSLLTRWGKWHRVRSLVGFLSFLIFLSLLLSRPR